MNEIVALGLSFLAGLVIGGLGGIATFSGRLSGVEAKVDNLVMAMTSLSAKPITCPLHSEVTKNIEHLEHRLDDKGN